MKEYSSHQNFEEETLLIKEKMESADLNAKIQGLDDLVAHFSMCHDLAD